LAPPRRALVLDSAYDLLRHRSGFYRDQPPAFRDRERRLLTLRREIPPLETPLDGARKVINHTFS